MEASKMNARFKALYDRVKTEGVLQPNPGVDTDTWILEKDNKIIKAFLMDGGMTRMLLIFDRLRLMLLPYKPDWDVIDPFEVSIDEVENVMQEAESF